MNSDWHLNAAQPYRSSELSVGSGATLTLDPGAVLKGGLIVVAGALSAKGTAAQRSPSPAPTTTRSGGSLAGSDGKPRPAMERPRLQRRLQVTPSTTSPCATPAPDADLRQRRHLRSAAASLALTNSQVTSGSGYGLSIYLAGGGYDQRRHHRRQPRWPVFGLSHHGRHGHRQPDRRQRRLRRVPQGRQRRTAPASPTSPSTPTP